MVKAYDFGIEVNAGIVSIPDAIYLKDMERFISELQRAQEEAKDPIKTELDRLMEIGTEAMIGAEFRNVDQYGYIEEVKAIRRAVLESVIEECTKVSDVYEHDGLNSHALAYRLGADLVRSMQWPED